MNEREIIEEVTGRKEAFGVKCSKYAGSITVEVIKESLKTYGIETSQRDVFIRGVPIEIDLLIPKSGIASDKGLLFEPEDVHIAIEVKNHGAFGQGTINGIKRNFLKIQQHGPDVHCFYVTLTELKGYKWAVTEESLGFPSYTLFWHSGSGKNQIFHPSGDWDRLIRDIRAIIHGN